jgi:succinate dehydrogenase / fumarate reductase cytochrome b subunit
MLGSMDRKKPAPRFLNLLKIKLPPGGIASIAHRISGVLMFLSIPLVAWLFARSLENEVAYLEVVRLMQSPPAVPISLLLVWSLSHHLLAGIRHLLLDIDIGMEKAQARASAWLVNVGALVLTAIYLLRAL